jgi:hypothetical protein
LPGVQVEGFPAGDGWLAGGPKYDLDFPASDPKYLRDELSDRMAERSVFVLLIGTSPSFLAESI